MKPFDLEEALNGKPVKLRNGEKAFVMYQIGQEILKFHTNDALQGFCVNNDGVYFISLSWSLQGVCRMDDDNDYDIIGMWEEIRPQVTLNLPCPLLNLDGYEEVYCPILYLGEIATYEKSAFGNIAVRNLLESGLLFASKSDAETWLEALSNSRC